jgi:hypothetical protein
MNSLVIIHVGYQVLTNVDTNHLYCTRVITEHQYFIIRLPHGTVEVAEKIEDIKTFIMRIE